MVTRVKYALDLTFVRVLLSEGHLVAKLALCDADQQGVMEVEDVLGTISERERRVLELRFGLEDGRSRTLEEVGHVFGVTRERIRQIEAKALGIAES